MSNTFTIKPGKVSLQELVTIHKASACVEIEQSAKEKINRAVSIVNEAAESNQSVYGINTGFGKLASKKIEPSQTRQLQENLILSHCCGVGEFLPDNIVRLIVILKLISLGRGASGVSWQLIQQLQALLSHNITPLIPSKGSVGASGDLAPLAHLTAVMIGHGYAKYDNHSTSGAAALKKAGLSPYKLGPKEGLGMINGTQVSTALALDAVLTTWKLAQTALITGALSTDALMASTVPFRDEIHQLRGHQGQIQAAVSLRQLLTDSQIREHHRDNDERVQDPYCIRCQPQVMGACFDLLNQAAKTLTIEANAVTDNPLIIAETKDILSGGNFHGEPVAFAADQCALAIAEIGSITERRIATLVDPALNYGLPAFLSPKAGLNSGFMIAEVSAAALMSENKHNASACSIDSTPTSANQEDHVSMACHAALRLRAMNENLASIIGIELLAAAQGIIFRRPLNTSISLEKSLNCLRKRIPELKEDRYMADDLKLAANMVLDGTIIDTIDPDLLPQFDN